MNGLGSGDNGDLTFLDTISLMSFLIGILNLNENLTQGDKQELMAELSNKTKALLNEIHDHLSSQDEKIDHILKILEDNK